MIALALLLAQAQSAACAPPPPGPPDGPRFGGPLPGATGGGGLAEEYDTGQYDAVLRAQGMSPAGIAVLRRPVTPAGAGQPADLAAARSRLATVRAARTLDVAALGNAMRAVDAAQARAAATSTERFLAALSRLSSGDRTIFVQVVGLGRDRSDGPLFGGPGGPGRPPPAGCPAAGGGPMR